MAFNRYSLVHQTANAVHDKNFQAHFLISVFAIRLRARNTREREREEGKLY